MAPYAWCPIAFTNHLKIQASDLDRNLSQHANAKKRVSNQNQKAKESMALTEERARLKSLSEQVTQQRMRVSDVKPIFRALEDEAVHKLCKAVAANQSTDDIPHDADLDSPLLMRGSIVVRDYFSGKKIAAVLTSYGPRYKKEARYESEHKATQPFNSKQGKEETEAVFATLVQHFKGKSMCLADLSSSWNITSWLFG